MTDVLTASEVEALAARIASADLPPDAPALVDLMRACERLVCVTAAKQTRSMVAFDAAARSAAAELGEPAARQGRGVAQQIGLARRMSPHRATRALASAKRLLDDMPHTAAAHADGRIGAWRAERLAAATDWLTPEQRADVDEAIAGDPERLERMGDREVLAKARALAADAMGADGRSRRTAETKHVSLRRAPADGMAFLTALLPAGQAIVAHRQLRADAEQRVAAGAAAGLMRSMADLLVERLTGRPADTAPPVRLHLVMTDRALFHGVPDPAAVEDWGPVSAEWARRTLLDALESAGREVTTWFRRLYTCPETGQLVAMDSAQRLFPRSLAAFIRLRDQQCRTPWCDAPVRHVDHVRAHADGGPTSSINGQGLCESCNHAKQAPGWSARPLHGPGHAVETTTPTGHRYVSHAPPIHDPPPRPIEHLLVEHWHGSGPEIEFDDQPA